MSVDMVVANNIHQGNLVLTRVATLNRPWDGNFNHRECSCALLVTPRPKRPKA